MAKDARAKLQQLFADYARNLPHKIAEIDTLWQQVKQHWDPESWDQLHRLAHTLTGTAGTYGYQQISDTARTLVSVIKEYFDKVPNHKKIAEIEEIIEKLKQCAVDLTPLKVQSDLFLKFTENNLLENRLVYFLGRDKNLTQQLNHLRHFDYVVSLFPDTSTLQKALHQNKPATIIVDVSTLTEAEKTEVVQFSNKLLGIPIIVISEENSLQDHLEAARMGSRFFLTKPLEINQVVDKLNQILDPIINPYRILIVEDALGIAEYFATILQEAGMISSVITDPLNINESLIAFKPELILMDLYMPGISGLELAAVLRHQPSYASIPIVFLSSEDDKTKQLEAMSLGGDDFITKPVVPEYLIWSVRNRAERYRVLRTLMLKDSLTGLFNHTNILKQLEMELLRAQRQKQICSFVMLDIDHFKQINDTYGHLVGDRVLKTLSLTLQQRLRRTDIIGRYGGEEFALVLPGTPYEDALKICENLKEKFIELQRGIEKQQFLVTFSGGIATAPPHKTTLELIERADEALYKAKHAGRNRVL
ncbi:MAG: diguanylate cyclase [Gammaproteobacteria bacterium]|nr:diguanylate cyclase [Gammaproteobacteria bacterium]